jgi:hypothetical protein
VGDYRLHRVVAGTLAAFLGLALVGSRIEPTSSANSESYAADDSAATGDVAGMSAAVAADQTRSNRSAVNTMQRPAANGVEPELPRVSVDTTEVATNGHVIRVAAGGDLQAAIDKARPGDRIALEPGATYRGPFRLTRKDGDAWIVIGTGDKDLVPDDQRVIPSDASMMARLVSASGGAVIETEPAAHHYRLTGLEILPVEGAFLRALIQVGAEEGPAEALAHHIIIDRCYLHGDPRRGTRRGIALNARESAVINSYLSDFKEVGADSQAIGGWNGPGPFKIENNYLEAAGENVMFGGADPSIDGLVPADIEIVGNHMSKPLSWRADDPHFQGTAWSVKNLFELKNARRVLVDGNLFEYNWPHAQNGFAILFTPRNQDGRSPWSVVEDVTFVNNLVQHVAAGVNVLGHDDIHSSQPTRRIAIRNNLFLDVGGKWGVGRLFQLLDGTSEVTIEHNTAQQTDSFIVGGDRAPHTHFVFQNNIAFQNAYGLIGSGTGPGRPTLDRYFPGAVMRRNVIIGGSADRYPSDNFFPTSAEQVGFVDAPGRDFRLKPSSSYKHAATDRGDVGADTDKVAVTAVRDWRSQLARWPQ